jgi:voltage-gated potassium channel
LAELDEPFICVDSDPGRIALAEQRGYLVFTGDAGEEDTLKSAGIERARVLATVLPDDAANVFITLTARELSDSVTIIARGESMATQRKLIRSGADQVVLPAAIGASRIANMVTCPSTESLLNDPKQFGRVTSDLQSLGLNLREVAIPPDSRVAGLPLGDVTTEQSETMLVVAIRSADGELCKNPGDDYRLSPGDRLFVVSDKQHTSALVGRLQSKRPELVYRGTRQP